MNQIDNKNKIIGFSQLRNELSKGNLNNWFKQMEICDHIYIYDQNSTDGSLDFYKKFNNVTVIESSTNDFKKEIICKDKLLTKLLQDHPDVDWILWLDGDSLLDGRLLKNNGEILKKICSDGSEQNIDSFLFNHYNLWRSDLFYRVDDSYHSLSGSVRALWRNNGNIKFNPESGLHRNQYPDGLLNAAAIPFGIVHRGFATDYQIITKYEVYKENGQTGWALDRLLNENGLTVEKLDDNLLPDWFELKDTGNPITKTKIIDIYNAKNK